MSFEALRQADLPKGELHAYKSGAVEEVYTSPGLRLNMAVLRHRMLMDVVAQQTGSIAVQTLAENGERKAYYFDALNMVDGSKPWLLARLDRFPIEDPSHDIVIGEPWASPLGDTEQVVGLARPYTHGYMQDQVVEHDGTLSPTTRGRQLIDAAVSH